MTERNVSHECVTIGPSPFDMKAIRDQRNCSIADAVRNGTPVEEVAKSHGVSVAYAYQIAQSHGAIADLRGETEAKALALHDSGSDPGDIARECERSLTWVQTTLKKHRRKPRRIGRMARPPNRSFAILADILNTSASMADIASKFEVSRQRVEQVCALAEKCGIATGRK